MIGKNKKGITLLVLILTIILMLILAAVTIGAINGGLFDYAGKAKQSAEDTSIADKIKEAYLIVQDENDKLTEAEFLKELKILLPNFEIELSENGEGFDILVNGEGYTTDKNGKTTVHGKVEQVQNAGDITKGGTCTGTQDNPYKIECIEDLVKLSAMAFNKETKNATKFYILTKDLDFNSVFSYSNYKAKYSYDEDLNAYIPDENATTTIKELCTIGQGFIPIGHTYNINPFSGTFDGYYNNKAHEIKNIYINTTDCAALFGAADNAEIKNLTISGNITSTDQSAGGIIVTAYSSTLNKCYNRAKIKGKTSASGIYGGAGSTAITECGNEGDVYADNGRATGIASIFGTSINKCYNKGFVSGTEAYGIAGLDIWGKQTLKNSYNTGRIVGTSGGAAGVKYSNTSSALNCFNSGSVTAGAVGKLGGGTRGVGGISGGDYFNGTYINCCSMGILEKLSGTDLSSSGLIAGSTTNNTNCYYLDGIQGTTGLTTKTGETIFYKTSTDPEAMTTAKVVTELNNYIQNPDEGVDTTGWCKWVVGDNNLPALDFDTEWNGTTWVTVSN